MKIAGNISAAAEPLVAALIMPEWLRHLEHDNLDGAFPAPEDKIRFAVMLAVENVRRGGGGPFGAAVFSQEEGRLLAVGVNMVVPASQSWAHAEMTAIARAQNKLGHRVLHDCVLASSCEPCAMCFGALPWSGIAGMLYGAPGKMAREAGFDEGDKVPDWHEALMRRNIFVCGPLLTEIAAEPFRLYRGLDGKIY